MMAKVGQTAQAFLRMVEFMLCPERREHVLKSVMPIVKKIEDQKGREGQRQITQ